MNSFFKNRIVQGHTRVDCSESSSIKNNFGNGDKWKVNLRYLEEKEKLGTGGALELLPGRTDRPIIVMNGDLLTHVNFKDLLDYHGQHNASATVCVREYEFQVPFGVVQVENNQIRKMDEKLTHRFFERRYLYHRP